MDRKVPASFLDSQFPPVRETGVEETTTRSARLLPGADDAALAALSVQLPELLHQLSQLDGETKVTLVHHLIRELEAEQIQHIIELALREINESQRRLTTYQNTRLVLKKDYSYQERGLSEPTQYYVYLRRRKPKLDRYIGTLFYVPAGCTLAYTLNSEGYIEFNPPNNVFRLTDSHNPTVSQLVRLICLQPPPPDYTFTKQQNDTPDIHLHLEYLDPVSHQVIAQKVYPFPLCMYEGGQLDRYRWEVSLVSLPAQVFPSESHQAIAEPAPPNTARRIIEVPTSKSVTLVLGDRTHTDAILKRIRLWVTWSEKAMPQSRWELIQDGPAYVLRTTHFKRRILTFMPDSATVLVENSLPVLMKWFHDLGLAVSQTQNQRQYSAAQLKLAHSLFIDMSLPQTNPAEVLKQLFGVEFRTG